MNNKYDSTNDTRAHIDTVWSNVGACINNLILRRTNHDLSKLQSPEKDIFDEMTPKLRGLTYGSDEYKVCLAAMKPALDHHYAHNSHHPEHYGYQECNGCFKRHPRDFRENCDVCGYGQFTFRSDISGMSLLDLLEMLCDWKAATQRHADGSLVKSLEINQKRFEISPQLQRILENTAKELCWT